MRVLVVDDEEGIRDTLRDALEDEGYATDVAADGVEDLQRLQQDRVHVVILDLVMPRMGGIELLRILRAHERLARIPVIVVTSDTSRAPAGTTVLQKPVDLTAILDAVARAASPLHPEAARSLGLG